jgi:hypothetical protein
MSSQRKVLAFDIGIKNLAFCVLENNTNVIALENCNILDPVEQVNCSKCTIKASYKAGEDVFCKRHIPKTHTSSIHETIVHPTLSYWAGSPDGVTEDSVMDIKCPLTIKSWVSLTQGENIYGMVDGFTVQGREFSGNTYGDKYYWQLVSNAILTGKKFAELIVFMPYQEQLEAIRSEADFQGINWIKYSTDDELPYVGKQHKNITTIRFEVPQKDIDTLTEAVTEAGKMLI